MQSKITGGPTEHLFTAQVLSKYEVRYYRCCQTGFIQTEEPYWLSEAYSSAITKLDVGLVHRNELLTAVVPPLLLSYFDHEGKFLDFAGGYGLFTRMMRDRGFDFYHTDAFCQNIFAEYNDAKNLPADTKFEAVTAFEVFEHLAQPKTEIENMLALGKALLFSTELVPAGVGAPKDWWYFAPETGQHIAFYTRAALEHLARHFQCHLYTDGKWLHIFSRDPLAQDPFAQMARKPLRDPFLIRKMRKWVRRYDLSFFGPRAHRQKESFLERDWNEALKRLR